MPLGREAETQAWGLFIFALTGDYPQIIRHDDRNQVIMNQDQLIKLQNYFSKWLEAKPSHVQVNLSDVISPVLLKKFMPWLVATPIVLLALGGILGRATK